MKVLLKDKIKESEVITRLFERSELIMDNSMFSTFACPMKGLLSYVLRLRPAGKGSLAMDFGTCIHAGLESLMKGGTIEEAKQKFIALAEELHIDDYCDPKRNSARGIEMLEMWMLFRANLAYDFQPITIDGNIAVELGVEKLITIREVSFMGPVKFIWNGRVDAVVRYKDKLWVLDHKTTSMLGDKFLDDKMRSNQFLGYYYALNELVKKEYGEPLAGCLINAICTGTKEIRFQLYELPFSEWQVEEWIEEIGDKMFNILCLLTNLFSDDYNILSERETCVTKYGRCPFFEVCDSNPSTREQQLLTDFEEHNWHPHHGEGTVILKG